MAKTKTCLWLGDVDSEKVVHPLLDEHPERGGHEANDKTSEPEDVHANILGRSLKGRERGGGVGSDHPTICEVVARGLIRDTLESVVHHIHWGGLETGIDRDQE